MGAFLMGVGVLVVLWSGVRALRHGRLAGDNPWHAWTLEWATTSPPPAYNFAALPPIASARPLWDLQHPRASAVEREVPDAARAWRPQIVGITVFIFSGGTFFCSLIGAFLEDRSRSPGFGPHCGVVA